MAGLLDYYKEHPELWAENEYLLKKDPAYDLGMMDLRRMNLEERRGGKLMTGLTKFLGSTFPNVFLPESMEQSSFSPVASPLGQYSHKTGDINLYTGPFTEGDVPTSFGEEEYLPVSNVNKAQVMAHENRHYLINTYPELYEAQPSWSTLDERKLSSKYSPSESAHWRQEAFNRYLDAENYPAMPFRTPSSERYPVGLSGINRIGGIRPTDMYFDKIWREHWKPHAKKYNKILKKIAASPRNVPETPIVAMDRGRDEPTRQASYASYERPGATGSPGYHWKDGGLATMFQRR